MAKLARDHPIGVVTDRDIVCRVVAEGKNPMGYTADTCMTMPVRTVFVDTPVEDIIELMETRQIRRVPVVDEDGCCAGIVSQADLVAVSAPRQTAELLSQISRDSGRPSQED
jgi:CBS domain-containing protein